MKKSLLFKNDASPSSGRPAVWTRPDVVRSVSKLCRRRYVGARDFPPYLYKLCKVWCGSVRAAKWEAEIIPRKRWNYSRFIADVERFAGKKYREDRHWPRTLRFLARRLCGSVRAAKWKAGIIKDPRVRKRGGHEQDGLWNKKTFLKEFHKLCRGSFKKPAQMGHMRFLAVRHCGSVRAAKWESGILKDVRKFRRR